MSGSGHSTNFGREGARGHKWVQQCRKLRNFGKKLEIPIEWRGPLMAIFDGLSYCQLSLVWAGTSRCNFGQEDLSHPCTLATWWNFHYLILMSPSPLHTRAQECEKMFLHHHCLWVQRVQTNSIEAGRVWVSSTPQGIPTTHPTSI